MKKITAFLLLFLWGGVALADDAAISIPSKINLKQGFLVKWKDPEGGLKNLTTLTLAETRPVSSWGKWNALWSGWTLDIGIAYDGAGINTGALLVGREFGVVGDYLPIDFPLKDKIKITLYPVGIYAEDITDHPAVQGASGVGVIKFDISF